MESVILKPGKQRRRPKVSCMLCRTRKIKCNRERPCSNCLRSRTGTCVYEILDHSSFSFSQQLTPSPESSKSATGASGTSSHVSSWAAESSPDNETSRLNHRIQYLESQIASATPFTRDVQPECDIEVTSSHLSGTFHLHYKRDPEHAEPIARGFSLKTRLLGQSHWVVSIGYLARDLFKSLEPCMQESSDAWISIERCKALARRIKAQRASSWPPLASELPSRDICDTLIDHYLQKTESFYRILHIPSFCREYEKSWEPGTVRNPAFMVQLKLVFAIGAVTYDDQFSLRTLAIKWIYEAQIWMSGPKYKARLSIEAMQTNLLLLIAQEQLRVGGEIAWVSAGALLRKAIYMGLHRDPSHLPQRSIFAAEMHRRLWNTIVEVNLQFSLACGGAPLISLDDFDTGPPNNFNDEQLETCDPIPKPQAEMTQISVALALRRTLPQRLAVVKLLNDLGSLGTYKQTLRLDAELRAAYRELCQSLRTCSDPKPYPLTLQYGTEMVDFLMQRYFSALHAPYFGPSLHGTAYSFSRKAVVDASLRIWKAACPRSPVCSSSNADTGTTPNDSGGLPRLIACSSGFYPAAVSHAAVMITMELRAQLQEDAGLNPVPLRPDLLSVLNDVKAWCLRIIEAGETNIKGYLLMSLVITQVRGLMDGLRDGGDQMKEVLVLAVEETGNTCLPILKRMAGAHDQDPDLGAEVVNNIPIDIVDNWDFMVSDSAASAILDATDPMSWIWNDDLSLPES
ncbi:uncharacterized protein BDW70DRAFT_168767 [Aspergillus foveolatus]|uniref:uncharacterized protein n=1 Tax=Aspergillus foveolatus TaxID=210207 RepID=UPI003CCDA351